PCPTPFSHTLSLHDALPISFACSHSSFESSTTQAAAQPYKALFFSPEYFRLVEHLAEMIIPADDTPGAREAGVAEFIDFMLANRDRKSTRLNSSHVSISYAV